MPIQIDNLHPARVAAAMRKRCALAKEIAHHPSVAQRGVRCGLGGVEPDNPGGLKLARKEVSGLAPVSSRRTGRVFVGSKAKIDVGNVAGLAVLGRVDDRIYATLGSVGGILGVGLAEIGLRAIKDLRQTGLIRFQREFTKSI